MSSSDFTEWRQRHDERHNALMEAQESVQVVIREKNIVVAALGQRIQVANAQRSAIARNQIANEFAQALVDMAQRLSNPVQYYSQALNQYLDAANQLVEKLRGDAVDQTKRNEMLNAMRFVSQELLTTAQAYAETRQGYKATNFPTDWVAARQGCRLVDPHLGTYIDAMKYGSDYLKRIVQEA